MSRVAWYPSRNGIPPQHWLVRVCFRYTRFEPAEDDGRFCEFRHVGRASCSASASMQHASIARARAEHATRSMRHAWGHAAQACIAFAPLVCRSLGPELRLAVMCPSARQSRDLLHCAAFCLKRRISTALGGTLGAAELPSPRCKDRTHATWRAADNVPRGARQTTCREARWDREGRAQWVLAGIWLGAPAHPSGGLSGPHAYKERKSTEREGHSSTLRWGIASAGAEALSRWFDSNERLLEHAERKIDRLAVPLLSGFVPL